MSADNTPQKKTAHPLVAVSGILGGIVGFYCGLMIIIPLIGGMAAMLLGKRFATSTLKPFIPGASVIFGHMLWMIIGVIAVHMIAPVLLDLIVMAAGLLWIVLRPGLGPVIFLSVYEVICLVVNIFGIIHLDFGTTPHKALTAHIALRLFALAALFAGYRDSKKLQATQEQGGEIPPDAV